MPFIPCPPLARFQFTPLREGRRLTPDEMGELTDYFNSRPSARGDTVSTVTEPTLSLFQFTPLRKGRRKLQCISGARRQISIHAPPRGATRAGNVDAQLRFFISIHAPPRGATRRTTCARGCTLFQFTPLREGRRCFIVRPPSCRGISIHAPPRGATRHSCRTVAAHTFQFTPLREGRRWRGAPGIAREIFNSRPSARGDCKPFLLLSAAIVFQFTPLREGRPKKQEEPLDGQIFQFTPLREGRRNALYQRCT